MKTEKQYWEIISQTDGLFVQGGLLQVHVQEGKGHCRNLVNSGGTQRSPKRTSNVKCVVSFQR